ncbi:WD40-repeat-containing domain protein [Cladochytrium replicatum]|nr:WD40-repeat-containing domain protein [Cladochytrium replicatum]
MSTNSPDPTTTGRSTQHASSSSWRSARRSRRKQKTAVTTASHTTSPLLNLPTELFPNIFAHLPESTFPALARASRAANVLVDAFGFRRICADPARTPHYLLKSPTFASLASRSARTRRAIDALSILSASTHAKYLPTEYSSVVRIASTHAPHLMPVVGAAEGGWLCGGWGDRIELWRGADGFKRADARVSIRVDPSPRPSHALDVSALTLHPRSDSSVLLAHADTRGSIVLWSVNAPSRSSPKALHAPADFAVDKPVLRMHKHLARITALLFPSELHLLSASRDHTVQLHPLSVHTSPFTLQLPPNSRPLALASSAPNHVTIAVSSKSQPSPLASIQLTHSSLQLEPIAHPQTTIYSIASNLLSNRALIATASFDAKTRVLDTRKPNPVVATFEDADNYPCFAIATDGPRILVGTQHHAVVRLMDVRFLGGKTGARSRDEVVFSAFLHAGMRGVKTSPVYGVVMDGDGFFATTDAGLFGMRFTKSLLPSGFRALFILASSSSLLSSSGDPPVQNVDMAVLACVVKGSGGVGRVHIRDFVKPSPSQRRTKESESSVNPKELTKVYFLAEGECGSSSASSGDDRLIPWRENIQLRINQRVVTCGLPLGTGIPGALFPNIISVFALGFARSLRSRKSKSADKRGGAASGEAKVDATMSVDFTTYATRASSDRVKVISIDLESFLSELTVSLGRRMHEVEIREERVDMVMNDFAGQLALGLDVPYSYDLLWTTIRCAKIFRNFKLFLFPSLV